MRQIIYMLLTFLMALSITLTYDVFSHKWQLSYTRDLVVYSGLDTLLVSIAGIVIFFGGLSALMLALLYSFFQVSDYSNMKGVSGHTFFKAARNNPIIVIMIALFAAARSVGYQGTSWQYVAPTGLAVLMACCMLIYGVLFWIFS